LIVSAKPPVTDAQEKIGLALIGEEGIGQVLSLKIEQKAQKTFLVAS
jgi:hypothetical protein